MAYGYKIKIAGATYDSVPEIKVVDADSGSQVGYYPYVDGLATVEQSGTSTGVNIKTTLKDTDIVCMKASELKKLLSVHVDYVTVYDIVNSKGASVSVFGFNGQTYAGGFGKGKFADLW